jgi:SagB-type dehydrogenase family enzyme
MTPQSKAEIPLPEPHLESETSVESALAARRSVREFESAELTPQEAGQLLWAAQGITNDERDRTAPSAGALQPVELYLTVGEVDGVPPGVYRYEPQGHALTLVAEGDRRSDLAAAALGQAWVRSAPAAIVITAVVQRTAKKYGDRARRYVQIEVGHVAQNVYLQAETLGLGTVMVGAFEDVEVQEALDLPQQGEPFAILPVGRPR